MSEGSADSAHEPDEDAARMVAYWTWVAVSMVTGRSDVDVTLRVDVVAERDRRDSAATEGRANDEADRSDRSTGSGGLERKEPSGSGGLERKEPSGSGGLERKEPSCESVPSPDSMDRFHRIARL
jgi:hypothetical protein